MSTVPIPQPSRPGDTATAEQMAEALTLLAAILEMLRVGADASRIAGSIPPLKPGTRVLVVLKGGAA